MTGGVFPITEFGGVILKTIQTLGYTRNTYTFSPRHEERSMRKHSCAAFVKDGKVQSARCLALSWRKKKT